MAKIIRIDNDIINIGMDNGTIKQVRKSDLNFEAFSGDEVDVYESENELIVTKKNGNNPGFKNDGININVSNQTGAPLYVANNTKAVNKVVYCVLAFFLGGIGGHKFYSGKISSGILYLLFSWTFIPAFIAFIEFIVALFKKADENGNILV